MLMSITPRNVAEREASEFDVWLREINSWLVL
jgi:hypothetical protein